MIMPERLAGFILLLIGFGVVYSAVFDLQLGTINSPDAGFMPFILGIGMVILALVWIVSLKTATSSGAGESFFDRTRGLKLLLSILLLLLYGLSMEPAGYFTSTLVFMAAWQALVERAKPLTILAIALVSAVAMFLLFTQFLKVPLPREFFLDLIAPVQG
jgi:putative tricarboxylic transport membrane protein